MKITSILPLVSLWVFTSLLQAENEPAFSEDTVVPDEFWFSNVEYTVNESETNALITVEWRPGNRSYIGWVDYTTSIGTATPGKDYEEVSGRLNFDGPAPRTFVVPIRADCAEEGEETIQLSLINTNATLSRSNATLKIVNGPCVPKIAITRGANHSIEINWPAAASDFVLERKSDLSSNAAWIELPHTWMLDAGRYIWSGSADAAQFFYRLRKAVVTEQP